MIYSYSSISTWLQCPRKFEAIYLDRAFSDYSSEISHGQRVHDAIDAYLKGKADLPLHRPPDGALEAMKQLGAKSEVGLGVTAEWTACGFWDKATVRLRGKMDVVILLDDEVIGVDWKTGKRRDNTLQASVYSAMMQSVYPGRKVSVTFDYLDKGRDAPIVGTPADRHHVTALMDEADAATLYPPKPSPLCRWCAVTTCEYNERRTG